ncbi:MAG: hypothetical protein EBX41_08585 [Chitinophagia bacterium]|nr:hypothetical protein [Chitinophagia bacterium]
MLWGCVKDKPSPTPNTLPGSNVGTYIICEGQYPSGSGSLYVYQEGKDSVFGDVYAAANGVAAGYVFQSMTRIGGYYYLCFNNSGEVVVIDKTTYRIVKKIPLPYPRYVTAINDTLAGITTLYSHKVYWLHLPDNTVCDSTLLPGLNPEHIATITDGIYITCWDTAVACVYRYSMLDKSRYTTLKLAERAPHNITIDKEQMLWVLAGNQPQGVTATLTRLDPSTGNILYTYTFPPEAEPIKLTINATKDTLYYIEANYYGGSSNNGIYRMGINEKHLPNTPLIPAKPNQYYWALGINPANGNIYTGNPKDFNQRGEVVIYNTAGVLIKSFPVGLGPSWFCFE